MKKAFSSIILPSKKKKKRLLPSRAGKAEEKRDKQLLDFKKCILYSGEGLTTRAHMTRSLINAMII